ANGPASAGRAAAPRSARPAHAGPFAVGTHMDWSAFRAEFPVTARWAFLDHAAVAPLSAPAVRVLHEYAASLAGNGIAAFRHWFDRIQHVRRLAAQLINAPNPDDVYFVPNTTHGIGVVAEGYPWRPGDNVVLAAE